MSVLYKTVAKEAEAEQIIERSHFISHIKPVQTREEADAFVLEIKKSYKDATHNVPAYVIGDKMQLQWASDDGEPQGTSGAPIVQMLVKEGVTNVCIVVTRYFGGIKLGTGGLVRAYTSSAKLALDAAGIFEVRDFEEIQFQIAYNQLSRLQNEEKRAFFKICDIIYEDFLTVTICFESENREIIEGFLTELTRGKFQKNT